MLTITLEEHFTTPDLAKAAQMPHIGADAGFMQALHAKLLDVGEGRIADMDAAGIDMQVLLVAVNTLENC